MARHLSWHSARFSIDAFVDMHTRHGHLVVNGDCTGAGAAVLHGALIRLQSLHVPVTVDASGLTAVGGAAAEELRARVSDDVTLVGASPAIAETLDMRWSRTASAA